MYRNFLIQAFIIAIITSAAIHGRAAGPYADTTGKPLRFADMDIDDVMRLKESGEILPLESVLQRVREIQPGRVIEIELEKEDGRYVYELEVVDERGVVWDIDIDARNGELIERERDD